MPRTSGAGSSASATPTPNAYGPCSGSTTRSRVARSAGCVRRAAACSRSSTSAPDIPHEDITWSKVGLTHISFDVKNPYKWYEFLKGNGVEIVSEVEESAHGHAFFFVKDCDGNLIELIDLRVRDPLLRYLGWFAGWLFKRGRYNKHYGPLA